MVYTPSSSSTDTSTTSCTPSSSSGLLFLRCAAPPFHSASPSLMYPIPPEQQSHHRPPPLTSATLFSFRTPPCPPSLLCLLVHLHSSRLLLHSSSETQCHCSRQVCISNVICFPVLSFYQAPAVIINNLSPSAASFYVSRLMFPAACWQRCQAQSLWCTERWRR